MVSSHLKMVQEFHRAFGLPSGTHPQFQDERTHIVRLQLLTEEVSELAHGLGARDMVECADALVDLLYVVLGSIDTMGLGPALDELFAEVHRSNMSKLDKDGNPIVNAAGRVQKSPEYTPPNLAPIVARYTERR